MTIDVLALDFHVRSIVEPEEHRSVLFEEVEVEVGAKESGLRLHSGLFLTGELSALVHIIHKDSTLVDGDVDIAPRVELWSPFAAYSHCRLVVGTAVDQFVVHLLP